MRNITGEEDEISYGLKINFIINQILYSTKHVVVHCILSWWELLLIWSSILRIISHIIHLHIIYRSGSRKCVGRAAFGGCRGLNPKFLAEKIVESLVTHSLLKFGKRRDVSIFFFNPEILNFYLTTIRNHYEVIKIQKHMTNVLQKYIQAYFLQRRLKSILNHYIYHKFIKIKSQ